MTVAPLLAALRREAGAERERVLAEARAEADRVEAASRAAADGARAARLDAARARLRAASEPRLAERRRATRSSVLTARQRLLERVFAAARDGLARAGEDPAYRDTIPARLERVLACVGGRPVDVQCAPALAGQLVAVAAERGLAVCSDPGIRAGLRVATLDGALVVDDTLDGALERRRAELALGVLGDLAELAPA